MVVLKYLFRGSRESDGGSIVVAKVEARGARIEIHCSFKYANRTKKVFLFVITHDKRAKSTELFQSY